jgi:hypothetical protein
MPAPGGGAVAPCGFVAPGGDRLWYTPREYD